MEYVVNKQSFYKTLEEIFNNLYGENYVRYNRMIYYNNNVEENNKLYNKKIEKNVLTDKNYKGILIDEKVIELGEKHKNGFIKYKEINNDVFYVNDEKHINEIEDLLAPYTFEYPFLSCIPGIMNIIKVSKEEKIISLNEQDRKVLLEILKEYKVAEESERERGFLRIRSKIKD